MKIHHSGIILVLIATGFMRMAPDSTTEREVNFVDDRVDVIADEIETISSSVMGLTMKCARCHSHKYDPLPQRDYYRFKAIFKGAYDEHDWVSPLTLEKYGLYFPGRYLPYVTPGATPVQLLEEQRNRELVNKNLEAEIKSMQTALEEKGKAAKDKLIEKRIAASRLEPGSDKIEPGIDTCQCKLTALRHEKRIDRLRSSLSD